jgi:hypothetical protein
MKDQGRGGTMGGWAHRHSADKTTGLIPGVSAGTAAVYAIDPETKCCGTLTVQVS